MGQVWREPFVFDHGAQFFTAQTAAFREWLIPLREAGVIACWEARFVELFSDRSRRVQWDQDHAHYVGVPGMNAIAKWLANSLSIVLNTEIGKMDSFQGQWRLWNTQGEVVGTFDWVVVAVPAAQASALLPHDFSHGAVVERVTMLPCYTLMLGFKQALPLSFDAALVHDADISWISVGASKPSRRPEHTLLVHATNQWASEHLEMESAAVLGHLVQQTSAVLEHDLSGAVHSAVHRWRYANSEKRELEASLIDRPKRLAVCGDWCIHGRVEAAFLSGQKTAKEIVTMIKE